MAHSKHKGSKRQIPLVGASLWAAMRVKETNTAGPFAFPKYTSAKGTNAKFSFSGYQQVAKAKSA